MGIELLPGECITHIISFTTPKDACRSRVLSNTFRSAADSDNVWREFLPPDCRNLLPHLPRKELYFHLCDHGLLMGDDNSMSLSLERHSGKKCWMISPRALSIAWKDDPCYWTWIPTTEFRFPEAAKLLYVWWLDIIGKMETKMLSPQTNYAAYLVFKFEDSERIMGLRLKKVTLQVFLEGNMERRERKLYLIPRRGSRRRPYGERVDGWLEIKLGEFYNNNGDDGTLVCNLKQIDDYTTKEGLVVGGIELRPA